MCRIEDIGFWIW